MGRRGSEADSVDRGESEVDGGKSEVDGGGEVRLYHDITPLLCHYVLEQHSSSSMLGVARGGWSRGRGGSWGVRVSEVEFLNHCWGMDLSVGKPHVI